MDNQLSSLSSSTLEALNYDCFFEVFQRLGFNECMSLAEAYDGLQSIADRTYIRKFNKLTIDLQPNGMDIDRMLYHAGPTAKSLKVRFCESVNSEKDLTKIGESCEQLRCLTISGFDSQKFANNPFANLTSEYLEQLIPSRECIQLQYN